MEGFLQVMFRWIRYENMFCSIGPSFSFLFFPFCFRSDLTILAALKEPNLSPHFHKPFNWLLNHLAEIFVKEAEISI